MPVAVGKGSLLRAGRFSSTRSSPASSCSDAGRTFDVLDAVFECLVLEVFGLDLPRCFGLELFGGLSDGLPADIGPLINSGSSVRSFVGFDTVLLMSMAPLIGVRFSLLCGYVGRGSKKTSFSSNK